MKHHAALIQLTVIPLMVVLLASCSAIFPNRANQGDWEEKQEEALNAYQKAGGRLMREQNSDLAVIAGVASAKKNNSLGITPASDLVWASEDPDEAMSEELSTVWKDPSSKSWQTDIQTASKLAISTEKPILIWFTDSAKSPLCNTLNSELFARDDFEKWAKPEVVRLSIDQFASGSNILRAEEAKKENEAKRVKELFGVNGYPTIMVLTPNGKVIDKFRGYKAGQSAYLWGRIKHSTKVAKDQHGSWREQMEGRGYRMWSNRSGKKIFAKLSNYTPQKTSFIEPNGKRSATHTNQLSDADQSWLTAKKKKYDESKGL